MNELVNIDPALVTSPHRNHTFIVLFSHSSDFTGRNGCTEAELVSYTAYSTDTCFGNGNFSSTLFTGNTTTSKDLTQHHDDIGSFYLHTLNCRHYPGDAVLQKHQLYALCEPQRPDGLHYQR